MITLIVGGLFAALGAAIPQGRAARPLVVESEVSRKRSGWSWVWKRLTRRRNRARQIQALPVLLELVGPRSSWRSHPAGGARPGRR